MKPLELITLLEEIGFNVIPFNNGRMHRIEDKVDIYIPSGRLFLVGKHQWITTTPETIKSQVMEILNK